VSPRTAAASRFLGGESIVFLATLGVGEFLGPVRAGEAGRFSALSARGVVGDELVPHHIPQAALRFTARAEGGAIVLPQELHVQTRTFGVRGLVTARTEASLSFRNVLARDIRDIRRISGRTYSKGLRDLIDYYRRNFAELLEKP
jgi:hypothetical protein